MVGVKSDKKHVGQEHRATARKIKGLSLLLPGQTQIQGGHTRGHGNGGGGRRGDGCPRLIP